jgi:hypothetical protein
MLGGIIVFIISALVSLVFIDHLKRQYTFLDAALLKNLFFFHGLLFLAYYGYVLFNPSDSQYYYIKVSTEIRGPNWSDYYGTSTAFIEFLGYPLVQYFKFSYEASMAFFSFLGFLGFVYFYIFFRENIRFKHTFFGVDLIKIVFFLPNLHFWSASFGKGSVIFLGLGLFFFGLGKLRSRWVAILIGGLIVYHVRPHVMLVLMASSVIGFFFTTKGVSLPLRIIFLAGASAVLFYTYTDVLAMVDINEDQFISQGLNLTNRARELTKGATSAVNITSYNLPMQIFTFLYRPLFFDAPGILGLIVSFENVFYLLITLRLFSLKGIGYLITSNFMVKTAFFSFLTVTIALAQISSNLGLAIRQKSQVMILLLFVIISFLDTQKMKAYRISLINQMRKARLAKLQAQRIV